MDGTVVMSGGMPTDNQIAPQTDAPDDLAAQIAAADELAANEGISPDEAWERLHTEADTHETQPRDVTDDTPAPKPEDTQKQPAESKPPESQATEQSPVKDGIDYRAEVDRVKKQLDSLQNLYGRQTQELGELRQIRDRVNPLLPHLDNPDFANHVLGYPGLQVPGMPVQPRIPAPQQQPQPQQYDAYDPNSVARFIESQTERSVRNILAQKAAQDTARNRAEKQRAIVANFQNAVRAGRDKLIADGMPETEVDTAIAHFGESLNKGDILSMAIKSLNYDKAVSEAEKRGRETAVADIKKKQATTPLRAVQGGKTPAKSTAVGTDFKNMSVAEFNTHMNSLTPDSPEWKRAMAHAEDMARRGL